MTLDDFRNREDPIQYSIIRDESACIKLLVAWPNTEVKYAPTGEEKTWVQHWRACEYDAAQWFENAGVSLLIARRCADVLINNRLIYPDGSVNEVVLGVHRAFLAKAAGGRKKK